MCNESWVPLWSTLERCSRTVQNPASSKVLIASDSFGRRLEHVTNVRATNAETTSCIFLRMVFLVRGADAQSHYGCHDATTHRFFHSRVLERTTAAMRGETEKRHVEFVTRVVTVSAICVLLSLRKVCHVFVARVC